jgi:hypothetical protein
MKPLLDGAICTTKDAWNVEFSGRNLGDTRTQLYVNDGFTSVHPTGRVRSACASAAGSSIDRCSRYTFSTVAGCDVTIAKIAELSRR